MTQTFMATVIAPKALKNSTGGLFQYPRATRFRVGPVTVLDGVCVSVSASQMARHVEYAR